MGDVNQDSQRSQSKQARPSSREQYQPPATPQPQQYQPPATPQPQAYRPPVISTPQPPADDVFEPNKLSFMEQPAPPMPPKILRGLKSEQVQEDETIILKALVNGNPFPRVKN